MSEIELLPCPFCGAKGQLARRRMSRYGQSVEWVVQCEEIAQYCPAAAMFAWRHSKAEAIAAWNRRAHTDADLGAALDAVREQARREESLPGDLAEVIEAEMTAWKGSNGGIFTIHACALAVSVAVRAAAIRALTPPPDLGAALATALEQARREEGEAIIKMVLSVFPGDNWDQSTADAILTMIAVRAISTTAVARLRARTPTTGGQADGSI